jgi:hypothetical protein
MCRVQPAGKLGASTSSVAIIVVEKDLWQLALTGQKNGPKNENSSMVLSQRH